MMVDKTGVGPEGEDVVEAESSDGDHEEHVPDHNGPEEDCPASVEKGPYTRTKSNQRWMKLRTTVQLSGAISSTIQKSKPPLKREDSFLKRFSTRQVPETQETMDTGDDGENGGSISVADYLRRKKRRRKSKRHPRTVVNPDENFYFYWLMVVTICVLYNLWTLIVRQSFPELQELISSYWLACDLFTDVIFVLDVLVQFRTGYLEQGLMVYDSRKLAGHYMRSRPFIFDLVALIPLDLLQFNLGANPMLRFPRFLKVYRVYDYYYMVESRTVYPNLWRVMNLIHILLILAHWFGCFYYLLSEAEGFAGDWVYPYRPGDYATLSRKYLGSLYWSTLTLTTIGDLPTPESNADKHPTDGLKTLPRRGHKSRLLQFNSNKGFAFTIVSYLIGVFIFATIVGQVGNVITNRNANRLEFERLLDGAKTYMRHHKVPGGMKRRVLRWYDYSWSRGRIQGGGDINTALGLLPDKLKTELALHVNLSVLKKVTIFHECQPEFLHDLVLKMKAYIFTPGDLICRKGEVAREMFIIADGILEVKSETGRVLTTMKAGDFFGEIGILNLDGLNRRTADVRSVGYSELFSLSREDVLAAMKDYPEAQVILQTLGRKRLMEARNMNRSTKGQRIPAKRFVRQEVPKPELIVPNNTESEQSDEGSEGIRGGVSSPGSSEIFDSKTGKRIVEKLRSDVKGLKKVLRKSRRGPRSKEECMELQPLTNSQDEDKYYREGKGILRRMARVVSDDTSQEDEAYTPQQETRIGAGLPLLQRLKLLKEKQDKEVIEKSEPSVSKEEEHEVIGAGLPLLQRLLLLKQKEDKERESIKIQTTANETAQVLASTVRTQLRSPPLSMKSQRSREKSREEEPLKPIILNRESVAVKIKDSSSAGKNGGVSWKDDVDLQKNDSKNAKDNAEVETTMSDVKPKEVQNQTKKPSLKGKSPSKFQNILKQAGLGVKVDKSEPQKFSEPTKPLGESHYTDKYSENKVTATDSISCKQSTIKKVDDIPINAESTDSSNNKKVIQGSPVLSDNKYSSSKLCHGVTTKDDTSSNIEMLVLTFPKEVTDDKSCQFAQDKTNAQTISIRMDEFSKFSPQIPRNKDSVLIDIDTSSDDQKSKKTSNIRIIRKTPLTLKLRSENKMYKSIDDLSPEYSGLPFVKQLRILNERQKLSELEENAFMRSSSLDSGHDTESREFNQISEASNLTRSHSEAVALEVVLRNQHFRAKTSAAQKSSPEGLLSSPESNETLERRNLKSILKKLSSTSLSSNSSNKDLSDNQSILTSSPAELRRLMRAQTVEGYAARHSKFTKSVTFNRDTLQSPPSDTTPIIASENSQIFPCPKVSNSLETPASETFMGMTSNSLDVPVPSEHFSVSEVASSASSDNVPICSVVNSDPLGHAVQPQSFTGNLAPSKDTVQTLSQFSEVRTTNSCRPPDSKPSDMPRKVQGTWIERPQAKQKNFFRPGSVLLPTHASHEEEFFGGILSGIKTIIQKHLEDVQNKFQTRFHDLEMEVKKRDDIIAQLQERIQELEGPEREESSGIEESLDAPFMRGDSVDTVICSPRRGPLHRLRDRRSWEDHSEEENQELMDLPRSITPQPVWNSTSIDMGSDSSGSFSTSEADDVFGTNDWEVKMLAKELERRESTHSQYSQEQVFYHRGVDVSGNVRRRRAVSFESVSREKRTVRNREGSSAESSEIEDRGSILQNQTQVEGQTGLTSWGRSLSISNLSNSLFRGLGTFVRGNVQDSTTDVVPTISQSCPPPPSPPRPPDI